MSSEVAVSVLWKMVDEQKAEVKRLGQGRIKLLKAFALMGSPLCEDLHHEKHQYHSHDEPCPVETKILDLIQEGSA